MNIVVLGDGILGSELVQQTGWDCISRKKDNFDIRNKESYASFFIENYNNVAFWNKYDVIVNCIAYTDTYSNNKEDHWNINYKSVVNLSNFCEKYNIKLIHISTDYVYTNSTNNASEEDIPIHGNNWYSYTKLLGDSYVQLNENNLVLRGTHKPNPFPYEKVWIDQIGNFDYVDVIANLIKQAIENNLTGVYNIGTELKSIYNLSQKTNKNSTPVLKPDYIPTNTSMNTDKLKNALTRNNK